MSCLTHSLVATGVHCICLPSALLKREAGPEEVLWLLELLLDEQWISLPCAAFAYTSVTRSLYSGLDRVKTQGLL